jgi:hypothetical protein
MGGRPRVSIQIGGGILDERHVLVVDDAPLLIEEEGIDVNVEGVVGR